MSILYLSPGRDPEPWLAAFARAMPTEKIVVWPDVPDPAAIDIALVWKQPPGELQRYPNLRLISSFGAGVEHLVTDPEIPAHIPMVRIVEDRLTIGMAEFVALHVLRRHRWLDEIEANQKAKIWKWLPPRDTPSTTVGILGLGALGLAAAQVIRALGFKVAGWSRTPKLAEGIECFHGPDQLKAFLGRSAHVACLLPVTPDTRGLLNRQAFAAMPRGSHIINAARGPIVVDADLLAALDSGHLDWATLDVFHEEPLPVTHPFWAHPRVTVTPHNAADSLPDYVVPTMVENIDRVRSGRPLLNLVDRARGY